MGADNLAQFHKWHRWRDMARAMPIAVVARPGYDGAALAAPAMAWLGRFRRPVASVVNRIDWSAPALVLLAFDPDPRSASAIRQADPLWAQTPGNGPLSLRDGLTRHLISSAPSSSIGRTAALNAPLRSAYPLNERACPPIPDRLYRRPCPASGLRAGFASRAGAELAR
jgi:nicotinate-nucleotide adenylyltransferase